MTYEEDYAYHLVVYGEAFKRHIDKAIERYPADPFCTLRFTLLRKSNKECAEKIEIFFNKWKYEEHCMSERTKIFVSLFEENYSDL
jgi:hypothetical protein